jgi:1-phosphofructokinase family hexose kinase
MIHCVNLNATTDHVFVLPTVLHGGVNRSAADLSYPGGKGCNAARAVALLGGKARLHAFAAAKDSAWAAAFFREHKVETRFTKVPGDYRPCVIVLDGGRNRETVINSDSRILVGPKSLAALKAGLLKDVQPGDLVTFSGSLPKGIRPDGYRSLASEVQRRGGIALLDSSGEGLRNGVEAAPFLVKPNAFELGAAFGVPVSNRTQVVRAARGLLRKGVRCVVVTLGARGAVCVTPRETLYAAPLPTPRGLVSPVGCGDSFLGGLAYALEKGRALAECLKIATAAAWANLGVPGAVFFDPKLVRAQSSRVHVSRLTVSGE